MSDPPVTYALMKQELTARQPQWSGVLPALLTPDRFLNFALLTLAETPKLLECTKASLLAGIYQAAKDGLELGRDAYLVPFRQKKSGLVEAVYVVDYRGVVKLLERTDRVRKAFAEIVYEHDTFDLDYGNPDKPMTHKPSLSHRGKPLGGYGAIIMKDGAWHIHYMAKDDIDRVKEQASHREQDPWITHWTEMARKTALKNVSKYCPLTPAVHDALEQDDEGDPAPIGKEEAQKNIAVLFGHDSPTQEAPHG